MQKETAFEHFANHDFVFEKVENDEKCGKRIECVKKRNRRTCELYKFPGGNPVDGLQPAFSTSVVRMLAASWGVLIYSRKAKRISFLEIYQSRSNKIMSMETYHKKYAERYSNCVH